jgi:hypothetical protein
LGELWRLRVRFKRSNARISPQAIFLARHAARDWGELGQEDIRENEYSLAHGFRLLSSYTTAAGEKLWIITEADRSATTLLLPDEY